MKITFMGTGTSNGIPVVNCSCPCCTSGNPHDVRWRSSIKVEGKDGTIIVVDTGPEFRLQTLKFGLPRLDAVLITHSHADHIHGLDDVRVFAHVHKDPEKCTKPLDIYSNSHTNADMRLRFDYVFKPTQMGGGKPAISLWDCDSYGPEKPIKIGCFNIIPVPMLHGKLPSTGWIFQEEGTKETFAYLTDCSEIPEASLNLVKNCSTVVIDALREKRHDTHLNFEEALNYIGQLNGKNFYFIHMCHDNSEESIYKLLPILRKQKKIRQEANILVSYDGLVLDIN